MIGEATRFEKQAGTKTHARTGTLKCNGCKKQFTVTVGTIFEDSHIALNKWLLAIHLMCSSKKGISALQLQRNLDLGSYRTAWFMCHRVRWAMTQEPMAEMLKGIVEVDETYVGGKQKGHGSGSHMRREVSNKTPVVALVERGGKVRTKVVANRRKKALQTLVRDNVEMGSNLYSDALKSYEGLDGEFAHQVIDHAEAYVNGQIHTNGCENFWSLLKRGINGTYVSIEPFHLFRYVDEQAFRFNNRENMTDSDRFIAVMKQIVGRRLTYEQLIGKAEEPRPETF